MTYEVTGDLIVTAVCHCHRCQRQGGSAFSVNLIVHESQLAVDGELTTYVETGEHDDGEYVRRRFCGTCGSPIVSELVMSEGIVAVKAGTLDDPTDVQPTMQAWCVDRQPWVTLPERAVALERE